MCPITMQKLFCNTKHTNKLFAKIFAIKSLSATIVVAKVKIKQKVNMFRYKLIFLSLLTFRLMQKKNIEVAYDPL